jgi:hypothetical protein
MCFKAAPTALNHHVPHSGFGVLLVVTVKFTICSMCLLELADILEEYSFSILGKKIETGHLSRMFVYFCQTAPSLYLSHSCPTSVCSTILAVRAVTVMIH